MGRSGLDASRGAPAAGASLLLILNAILARVAHTTTVGVLQATMEPEHDSLRAAPHAAFGADDVESAVLDVYGAQEGGPPGTGIGSFRRSTGSSPATTRPETLLVVPDRTPLTGAPITALCRLAPNTDLVPGKINQPDPDAAGNEEVDYGPPGNGSVPLRGRRVTRRRTTGSCGVLLESVLAHPKKRIFDMRPWPANESLVRAVRVPAAFGGEGAWRTPLGNELEESEPEESRRKLQGNLLHVLSIGARGSTVFFHHHGDAWITLLAGRKRWFVFPRAALEVLYNESDELGTDFYVNNGDDVFVWVREKLRRMPPAHRPFTFVQRAGEAVYVPAGWTHATINLADGFAFGQQNAELELIGPEVKILNQTWGAPCALGGASVESDSPPCYTYSQK